jgi:O-antigen/teichoic acid export membrane protein
MKRLLSMVPPGSLAVGGGLAVLGLASYVHLAIAGHTLSRSGMSSVSVLWSLVFALGPGLFFPIEQEMTRIIAARRQSGGGAAPVLRRSTILAAALVVALFVVLIAARSWLADKLFDGDAAMVWVLAGGLAALAMSSTTRGVLAGAGAFGWYGTQLGVDGALRIVMAVALGVAGVHSAVWFGLALVFAPIASVLLTLPAVLRLADPGSAIGWRELMRGLGLLTVSALLAQLLVNIAVVDVRLLAPDDVAVTGAVLAALVLVRVPLFLFASIQASLLSGLSAAVALGQRAAYRLLLVRALAVVTALGVIGTLVGMAFGPRLIQALFGAADVLHGGDFAWLAVGTMAYLWAVVLGQGVLSRNRHRDQALAWVVGIAVLIAATLAPGGVLAKVERGYALGALTVAAAMLSILVRLAPRPWPSSTVESSADPSAQALGSPASV